MTLAEALEAELLRIDPQENGAKTKADLLATVAWRHLFPAAPLEVDLESRLIEEDIETNEEFDRAFAGAEPAEIVLPGEIVAGE